MTGLAQAAFLICAGLVAWFMIQAKPKARVALVIAWLFPGAGHLYLGRKERALFLGGLVVLTFLVGMFIADFRNISPFDRHPIWGIAQVFGGLMTVIAALATGELMIETDNPYYNIGCLYSGVACLLNVLVMIDAVDLASAEPKADAPAQPEEEAAA